MLRYGSVNVPITSVGVIVYGLIMALSPPSSFLSAALQQGPFTLMGQRWWAYAFIGAGVLALAVRHLLAVFPLLLVVAGFAVSLIIAAAIGKGVTPVAGITWAIIAVELLVSVSIRGTGARPRHAA